MARGAAAAGIAFLFAGQCLSAALRRAPSQSEAESKATTRSHRDSGMSCCVAFLHSGLTMRYHPTWASAAAWRGFMLRFVARSSQKRKAELFRARPSTDLVSAPRPVCARGIRRDLTAEVAHRKFVGNL